MQVKRYLIPYLAILITYLIADFIWLGIVAKSDYTSSIGDMMRNIYPIWPWAAFYLIYSACILRLTIFNGAKPNIISVGLNAFVLGVASYGAYNLTNYAIIADWPLGITFKDWAWGTCVTTMSAIIGYLASIIHSRFIASDCDS
ncbi:DUF2177 family protein [Ningiella sp. W23]|uniref:DUF2177 family protein n=1 Tax=Ningiella sp. W23 TaxID=3023715 RepID=UPI003757C049